MKWYLTWNSESRMYAASQLACAGEPQKTWRIEELDFSEARGGGRAENVRTGLAEMTRSLSLCNWPSVS